MSYRPQQCPSLEVQDKTSKSMCLLLVAVPYQSLLTPIAVKGSENEKGRVNAYMDTCNTHTHNTQPHPLLQAHSLQEEYLQRREADRPIPE